MLLSLADRTTPAQDVLHVNVPLTRQPVSATLFFTQDEDPYVRKTAAVCVAKLYDINAEVGARTVQE